MHKLGPSRGAPHPPNDEPRAWDNLGPCPPGLSPFQAPAWRNSPRRDWVCQCRENVIGRQDLQGATWSVFTRPDSRSLSQMSVDELSGDEDGCSGGKCKCYVAEIGQVRRVLEIKEARVKYESRGKTAHGARGAP